MAMSSTASLLPLFPLLFLFLFLLGGATSLDANLARCEMLVESWSKQELENLDSTKASRHGDALQLQDLLFFLHIPRTGGRTYYQCFLRNLFPAERKCARSYDKLRVDTSTPNCRLLSSHDDYSLMTKLPQNMTSVVTNMRHPFDRVVSAYEFSVEVASRFLRQRRVLTSINTGAGGAKDRSKLVSTLDIWPWRYLVPMVRADAYQRRDGRANGSVSVEYNVDNTYDVPSMVMPLHEFVRHPLVKDLVHNGAMFQIAGLTNYSVLGEAQEIRNCVKEYDFLGESIYEVSKRRLDEMLYVGLTEKHEESAIMFATVVGGQLRRKSVEQTRRSLKGRIARNGGSWAGHRALGHRNFLVDDAIIREDQALEQVQSDTGLSGVSTASAVAEQETFIKQLLEKYQTCVTNLQNSHRSRRSVTLSQIKPVNFSRQLREKIPMEVISEIHSQNVWDLKLFSHAQRMFEQQERVVNQADFLEKRILQSERSRNAESREMSMDFVASVVDENQQSRADTLQQQVTKWYYYSACLMLVVWLVVILRTCYWRRAGDRRFFGVQRGIALNKCWRV